MSVTRWAHVASHTASCIAKGSMMPQDGLDMASDSSRLPLKITKNSLNIYYFCLCLYGSNKGSQDGIRSLSDGTKTLMMDLICCSAAFKLAQDVSNSAMSCRYGGLILRYGLQICSKTLLV